MPEESEENKEAKIEETVKKVEGAFPKEDAHEAQPEAKPLSNEHGTPLWVGTDPKEKEKDKIRPPSQTDIMLYLARETHLLRLEMEAFLNKVYASVVKQTPIDTKSTPATPISGPTAQSTPTKEGPPKPEKMVEIEEVLKEYLEEFVAVNVDESNMFYIISFKKFLGAELFSKISTICRAMGGTYVSAGKKSHFTIPKQ